MADYPDLRLLFHRLNNQLGIILANAELVESKATDDLQRARASQIVTSALEAMGTAKAIRRQPSSAAIGRPGISCVSSACRRLNRHSPRPRWSSCFREAASFAIRKHGSRLPFSNF